MSCKLILGVKVKALYVGKGVLQRKLHRNTQSNPHTYGW